MTETVQQSIKRRFKEDINYNLDIKLRYCLEKNGFDFLDYNRVLVKNTEHYDDMNELWLDGVCILKWSKFSFKQEGFSLIGSFEYLEL